MTYPPEEANENGKRRATASGRADDRLVASMERADVVLTTYAALERDAMRPGFRPLHAVGWRRVVLDECQEIRSSTTALARLCASMRSVHRWMGERRSTLWLGVEGQRRMAGLDGTIGSSPKIHSVWDPSI